MQFHWNVGYDKLAERILKKHFPGGSLSGLFPCMRTENRGGAHRPFVGDARIPIKNNTEYHGLENHAAQYHVTAQYEVAYHYWLLAGYWRQGDMEAHGFTDAPHRQAVEYCLKQALYNRALYRWQRTNPRAYPPQPGQFGLTRDDIDAKDQKAEAQIAAVMPKTPQAT